MKGKKKKGIGAYFVVGRAISASILSHVLLLVVHLLSAKDQHILRTFTGGKVACGEPPKT